MSCLCNYTNEELVVFYESSHTDSDRRLIADVIIERFKKECCKYEVSKESVKSAE